MRRSLWVVAPLLGVAVYATAPIVGREGASLDVYGVAATLAVATYWLVVAAHRPRPVRVWALVGAGLTAWVAGDLAYSAIGSDPMVSAADGLYVAGYAAFIVATTVFLRRRTEQRDIDSAIDAALIGLTCLLLLWVVLIGPAWDEPGVSNLGRIMSALYPVLDVVLLFFLVRMLFLPGRVRAPLLAFAFAVLATLVADTTYAALQQHRSYEDVAWNVFDSLWLLGYALLPVAALLGARADPAPERPPRRASRLVGLLAAAIALVALPAAGIASQRSDDATTTAVLASSSVVIVVLVFARYIRLHASLDEAFAAAERQRRYYRAVAEHGSDSYFVVSPEGLVLDAAGTLGALVGETPASPIGRDGVSGVHPDDRELAANLLRAAVADPGRTVPGEVRALTSDGRVVWVQVFCTNLCDDPFVGGIVVNAHDITARKAAEAALEFRAQHDAVTGLANRALLRDRIQTALDRRVAHGTDIAVLFCDLDGFKLVNDTIGHDAGDEVLRIAAARFLTSVRPTDTLARIGGDEFAVLVVSDGDLATEVEVIAGRLLEAMAQPVEVMDMPMVVTTSIGIALAPAGAGCSPDDLLRDADTAMYSAKAAGRNRAVRYEPSMGTAVFTRVQLGSDVRLAVARDELVLRYQPIVELASGGVIGFEALLRWNHPTRGLLGPDDFIAIAEDAGTIFEIGDWVLHQACRDASTWAPTVAGETPVLSVNVSGRQLLRPDFVERTLRALVESTLPASSLMIEITESTLVDRPDPVAARLRALKATGVRVAIDDFGVGKSGLGSLRQLPIDVVKLDQSLVGTIGSADALPPLVGGVLQLARTLGLRTLAEGIETPEQHAALARAGCELGQGFLFAHPVDDHAVGRMLGGTRPLARRDG